MSKKDKTKLDQSELKWAINGVFQAMQMANAESRNHMSTAEALSPGLKTNDPPCVKARAAFEALASAAEIRANRLFKALCILESIQPAKSKKRIAQNLR